MYNKRLIIDSLFNKIFYDGNDPSYFNYLSQNSFSNKSDNNSR